MEADRRWKFEVVTPFTMSDKVETKEERRERRAARKAEKEKEKVGVRGVLTSGQGCGGRCRGGWGGQGEEGQEGQEGQEGEESQERQDRRGSRRNSSSRQEAQARRNRRRTTEGEEKVQAEGTRHAVAGMAGPVAVRASEEGLVDLYLLTAAIFYAQQYALHGATPSGGWKFNKARQGWLIRQVWSVPDEYVDVCVGYLKTVVGGVRSVSWQWVR